MLEGYDPSTSILKFPKDLTTHGLNPFGEPIFRIVETNSRRFLCHVKKNGSGLARTQWAPLYPHLPNSWVLEKWLDAFTFTGMSPQKWGNDADAKMLGPYPSRGEYVMCGNTDFDPYQTNVDKLINMVNAGTRYSWAEKLAACQRNSEAEQAEQKRLRTDIIRDSLPSFGSEAISARGGNRGTKTAPVLKSANELHLPRPTNQMVVDGGSRMMTARQARRFGFSHRKFELAVSA